MLTSRAFSQDIPLLNLEKYVGYYNVGVRPGAPFFKARVYLRNAELYIIFDGDSDHKLIADANGAIRFDASALSRYLITFNFKDDKANSFKVARPRDKWPTDLF